MISFSISELGAFQEWVKTSVNAGARRGALSAAMRCVNLITTQLIPGEKQPPVFMRAYAAGWRAEPTPEGADVVNTVPYAEIIEYGARPEKIKIGRKMIDALQKWVLTKGLVGKKGRSGTSLRASQEVQARNVAWAIAQNMKKVGIFNREGRKGLRIGERATAQTRKFLPEEMKREILRELRT